MQILASRGRGTSYVCVFYNIYALHEHNLCLSTSLLLIIRNVVSAIFYIRKLERMQAVRQTHVADNSTGNLIVSVAFGACFLVCSITFNTENTACCDMQFLPPLLSFILNIFNPLNPCLRCLQVCQIISSLQQTRFKFPLVSYISQSDPTVRMLDKQSGLACVGSLPVWFSVSLVLYFDPVLPFFCPRPNFHAIKRRKTLKISQKRLQA